jgi:hypothetical protein
MTVEMNQKGFYRALLQRNQFKRSSPAKAIGTFSARLKGRLIFCYNIQGVRFFPSFFQIVYIVVLIFQKLNIIYQQ